MKIVFSCVVATILLSTSGCVTLDELGPDDESAEEERAEEESADRESGPEPAQDSQVQLHFLYVHGVKGCQNHRLGAENSLDELEAAVNAELPSLIAAYEMEHPGVTIVTSSARANLYTATPSPYHPSDSPNPINMDDWEVGDPGCTTSKQGEPCTTAYEWRHRLAREIQERFPADAKNIVLVGHSSGARVAFEVAANVGPGGVGTQDWGVQDRIAGVVSIQGMVDSLGTSKYNVVGPFSFVNTCKYSDPIVGFGDNCALGNGWCEYAGNISGFAAADWVAQNKHALMLTSWASCSPSLFSGYTDGPLPFDAQGSPLAVGTSTTPAPGKTHRVAHGIRYGAFCHSAIVDPNLPGHAAAVAAARDRILQWLFVSASRVAAAGTIDTPTISHGNSTPVYNLGSTCPPGHADGSLRVVGNCKHPGFFDGDDHPVASSEITLNNGPSCNGSFSWRQQHDTRNRHAATFWWKTYSLPSGAGLVHALPVN